MLGISVISQVHYILNIIHEVSTELKIKVFRVKPKEPLLEEMEMMPVESKKE
jgi:hypothetical protein